MYVVCLCVVHFIHTKSSHCHFSYLLWHDCYSYLHVYSPTNIFLIIPKIPIGDHYDTVYAIRHTAIMQTDTPIWPVAIRFSHFLFLTEMLNHRKFYCKGIFRNAQIFIMKHSKLVIDMERHMAIVIRKRKANRETACNLASSIPQNDYLESFSIPI